MPNRSGRAGERRTAVPLGKLTAAVVFGNTLAISDGTDWTIRLIDVDTRAESFYLPPGRFSPTDVTPQYLSAIRERRRGLNRDIRRFLDRAGVPSSLPPYGWSGLRPVAPLVAARDGSLWAALVTGPGEGTQWRIFGSTAGVLIAASTAPIELLAVGGGIAVTKGYDSLGVEHIEVRSVEAGSCQ